MALTCEPLKLSCKEVVTDFNSRSESGRVIVNPPESKSNKIGSKQA